MSNITQVSHQWATRPDDERFTSLADLKAHVQQRKKESWTAEKNPNEIRVVVDPQGRLKTEFQDITGSPQSVEPTNWAFGQLSQYAQAPASYLRKLPAELAAINLQWGLDHLPLRDSILILSQYNGDSIMRAVTSSSYGRIWDIQVVEAVEKANVSGRWVIPSASYADVNPKRATTLYSSDRDVFIFLVDPNNAIEVNGETLFRGFITWNSEVGSAVFGLTTFLYRYVCDNRIVWGATDVKELRIRHTGGAPDRFAFEGSRYLRQYAEESPQAVIETIKKAQAYELPPHEAKGELRAKSAWETWLTSRGFTKTTAHEAVKTAVAEMGEAKNLWQIVNGITAYARSIPHTDNRVNLETQAGKLLELVRN